MEHNYKFENGAGTFTLQPNNKSFIVGKTIVDMIQIPFDGSKSIPAHVVNRK